MTSGEESIRVLIVDDFPETRENLRKLLYFESDIEIVGMASSGEEAIEVSRKVRPHIVLMDINMPGVDGIAASEAITREVPYAQIVMMSVQSEADYLRRSMLAGARDFLTKPFSSDDLVQTIRRVYELHARPALESRRAAPTATATVAAPTTQLAKLIVVYSPKGGAGCTTVSVNLATMLCRRDPSARIALVDASMQFGDVDVFLNLRANRSAVDLAGDTEELEWDLVEGVLLNDERSGLKALLAPPKPEMAELITTQLMRRTLELMEPAFDYVIVDSGSTLTDMELSLFDVADRILLILEPVLPAVKDARNFFGVVEALGYSPEKILVVLNKSDPAAGITAKAIERYLKCAVFAEIPNEGRIVLHSINHGVPYVLIPNLEPHHRLIEATRALADSIVSLFAEPEESEEPEVEEHPLRRLFR